MRARLTSSRFIGRVGELAELELALRDAAARRPALVLLGGDSGVGKTRLVGELVRRAPEGDVLVLRGEGVEQADGELPYAPLVGALRPLVRERHPGLAALSAASRAQLAAMLPGLDQQAALTGPADASGPLRLFEALLELLDLLCEQQTVLLILEDMHWADRSTRTFVSFLARGLRAERLMLLITYRADELHRRHALRPLLSELERLGSARRVDLFPFDRDELAQALADIIGDTPSERLVERLFNRSEGNPLYTEELLAAGLDGRGAAPQSLRDAFLLRIERLSEGAQRAARTVAVGRALDEAVIGEVTGIEHDSLHQALREAVSEQVLIAGEDGRFCFRHALLREAVYDDLLPGERGELHLVLARTFEAELNGGPDRQAQLAAAIANHYATGGDQPAALRANVRAALAARDVHAYGDAANLADRALELWPRVAESERDLAVDHVELLTVSAAAHSLAGDRGRAELLVRGALQELDPELDPSRYSALLARLARMQWSQNRGLEGVETAQRALAMLPAADRSPGRASLLAWLARTQTLRGRYREAVGDGEAALAAAVAAGDRRSECEVLNTLGMAQIALGQVDDGVVRLHRAIEIAREEDDIDSVATAHSNLADLLSIAGRTRDALDTAQEGLRSTPRRLTRSHEWLALTLSAAAFESGDWSEAQASLDPVSTRVTGTILIFRLVRDAELALGRGDEERAARSLEEAEPLVAESSEPQWIGSHGALLAELRRRQRDLESARAVVQRALDRIELCTDDVARIARVAAVGATVEADVAQRARDLREKKIERDAVTRARLHEQRLRAAAADGGPIERAWRAVGAAELARARGRDDAKLWSRAAEEWTAVERPYPAAMARWREAEAQVQAGEREAAAAPAASALEIAERLGSRWLSEEVRALVDRGRISLAAGEPQPQDPDEDPFGLTRRERQVLALVAEGATNRQIGAALYMAEKTASVHVSRILAKLGVHSRTQAAAVAHRLRLDR